MAGADGLRVRARRHSQGEGSQEQEDGDRKAVEFRRSKSEGQLTKGPNDSEDETELNDPIDKARWHHPRDSLLSSKSGFNNYRGLVNFTVMLLIFTSARLAVDNFNRYGMRFSPLFWFRWFINTPFGWQLPMLFILVPVFILAAIMIERARSQKKLSQSQARTCHVTNMVLEIMVPICVVVTWHPNPAGSTAVLFVSVILLMKLISWEEVNRDRSEKWLAKKGTPRRHSDLGHLQHYPENVNFADMAYFLVAPTLCYELNFPRNPRIRVRFLLRRLVETVALLILLVAMIEQWLVPGVQNSLKPLQQADHLKILERQLKLAIPNIFVWLLFFYVFFHCFLNLTGELLRFADRQYYRDWFNATTLSYFWKSWNIPVTKWCARHIYLPMLRNGYKRHHASLLVFFLSAVFHELMVAVPLQLPSVYFFFGMLGQVPLVFLTDRFFKNSQYGNVIVWFSLIWGQPYLFLMYARDYLALHPELLE